MKKSRLRVVLSRCKKSFISVGFFSCFVNVLQLTIPLYMLQVFDRVLASQGYDTLMFLTILAIFALFIMGVLDAVRSKVLIKVSHWMDNHLSPQAFARSTETIVQGNQYTHQSLRDIGSLRDFLCGNDILCLVDAPWAIIYILVIYLLHPLLGLIATVGVVLLLILSVVNELVTREAAAASTVEYTASQSYVSAALRNAEAVQAMGMLDGILRKWFTKNEQMIEKKNHVSNRSASLLALAKFFRMMLQITILGTGAYLVVANRFTPGAMIAASILTSRAMAPVVSIIGTWKRFIGVKQAYRRLVDYLVEADPLAKSPFLTEPKGHLRVESLYYQPAGVDQPVIKGVSVEILPGDIVAVMGPSGAGKSTLLRLLLGIWKPNHGRVSMDGCDVAHCDRIDLGQHVGYCPQEVQLFPGSVRENISRMKEGTDDLVVEAATFSGVHNMILQLPKGYNTVVGSYGLSGGQKQRVALARAFYGSPCLVVLDEPNSNLDEEGSISLMNAILAAKQRGVTIVIVTHQPKFLQVVDKVMVIKGGLVQAFGPREQVFSALEKIMARQSKK